MLKGERFMYNLNEKEELISVFTENAKKNARENLSDLDIVKFMDNGDIDLVRECVNKIKAVVNMSIPGTLAIPKYSLYISGSSSDGAKISLVSISITQRIKSTKKFKFKIAVTTENTVDTILDFLIATYTELLVDELAESNVAEVNELIDEVVKEAGLSYEVSVVTALGNEGKVVTYLGDDMVQFVADENRIFDLEDILALQGVSEVITEEAIISAKQALVDEIITIQTPEQLIQAHGGALLGYICNINKRVKPFNIVKSVSNRNIEKVLGNKDCLTYFYDAEKGIFSIIAKRGNDFEVVLSPFDVKTFRKVDFDVLGEVAKRKDA